MTTTTTTVQPGRTRRFSLEWIAPAFFAIAALVLMVALSRSMPDRQTITIVNRTGAEVTVRAADASRDGWLGIGTLDPKSRATTTEVVDEGSVWRFRLTAGPDELGEITRTEQQLRAAGWTLTIPAEAADRLPELRRTL
ncbi:MAG: hypothetical protein ACXWAY_00100 [Acidimicrobiia bacterium]